MRHFVRVGGGGAVVEDRTDRSQNSEAKGVDEGRGESKRGYERARLLLAAQIPKYLEARAETASGYAVPREWKRDSHSVVPRTMRALSCGQEYVFATRCLRR
jgi:hypothetical protein